MDTEQGVGAPCWSLWAQEQTYVPKQVPRLRWAATAVGPWYPTEPTSGIGGPRGYPKGLATARLSRELGPGAGSPAASSWKSRVVAGRKQGNSRAEREETP